MKYEPRRVKPKRAAGGVLLLVALLMISCNRAEPGPGSAEVSQPTAQSVAAQPNPTEAGSVALPSPIPPTATPLPTAPPEPLPSPAHTLPAESPTPTAELTDAESPAPAALIAVPPGMAITETNLTLPTYPFRDFLIEQLEPPYNMPVFYLDRAAYEATDPTPVPVEYQAIILENPYLRLTFLPELGGRLYSAVVKATGQEIFYHNPVVKPTRYGILQPPEANWWLASGGMEWAYPVQEHGYRFGVPWTYRLNQSESSLTIILSDTGPDRVGLEVAVTLPVDSASFTVAPTLTNNGTEAGPVQLWLNAALALAPETMSLNTRFIIPTEQVLVHSRGGNGWQVADSGETSAWPLVDGKDLSDYSQWADYLGFFVPQPDLPFMGAYNPDTDLGVVRLGPGPGHKLFAFGKDFWDKSYSDNNSQYFEMWGGVNSGFWPEDDVSVAPGQSLQWQEQWWPLAGLGGLTWATPQVAISLSGQGETTQLAALLAQPQPGQVIVQAGAATLLNEPFEADPARPLVWQFAASAEPLQIQFIDNDGLVLLNHCRGC